MRAITAITIITIIIFIVSPVYSAESTPSADIKLKLEELKREIASKAAKLKLEVDKKLKDKAFIGKVQSKSRNSLTLDTKNGTKLVTINQDTVYPKKALAENDYIASLGDVDDTGTLTAKKIIVLPTPNSKLKTYLWGQIVSISDKLVTLRDAKLKNVASSLPNSATVKVSDFVILTGSFGKNDIFEAEFVYVIPQGGILKPKKIATPSAKIASPSASPKPVFR